MTGSCCFELLAVISARMSPVWNWTLERNREVNRQEQNRPHGRCSSGQDRLDPVQVASEEYERGSSQSASQRVTDECDH